MKKLFILSMTIICLSGANRNSFKFAERPFGSLTPAEVRCTEDEIMPYHDIVYKKLPKGHECIIHYTVEKYSGPSGNKTYLKVFASEYEGSEQPKLHWIMTHTDAFASRLEGKNTYIIEPADDYKLITWISGNFYIEIMRNGPYLPEVDEITKYYLDNYPPTFTVTAADLDNRKVNINELNRHMEIIWNGEKYRGPLRSKEDRYAGTMAQCHEEMMIRVASGLCEEALIDPENPRLGGRKKAVGCPIAMNFNDGQRKDAWKDLEKRALESETIDFTFNEWDCGYTGLQWYHGRVLVELKFTRKELLDMYDHGVPKQYLPEGAELIPFVGIHQEEK